VVLPVRDPLLVGVAALNGMVVHFDYVQVLGRGDINLVPGRETTAIRIRRP
jgi:hypothetical protein